MTSERYFFLKGDVLAYFHWSFFSVTEEEFLALAENLRPWTKRAMKIEVAPWIRNYVTEMQELYCELILEEVVCKPFGLHKTLIKHYQILFDNALVPAKILAKGDPGIGKTTLAKKIAWDWAKKDFKNFSLILIAFLKLVHPDDTLEKAMIEQIPELEGLHISPSKLQSFIEHFGERCLLILDGLDEHAIGSNKDVLKVLQHRKYLNCNILVTSRPHSTAEIRGCCDTVVSVEGFTRSEARKFASAIVRDERAVEQILDFNPTGGKQEVVLHKCPVLLSFMCILVREKAVDLTNKTMPTGEIYTRMIQCLYKKFTLRRGIRYDDVEFTKVVGLVGKLAWESLLSGDPLFQRSRVEREVGKDAFDYGFLIGNEDLIGNVKADILITFAHRSIQEFFGAFFFVLQLIQEKDIDSIVDTENKDPIFMKNPLFLHFIFWFLSEKCGTDYLTLGNKQVACEILDSYIYHKIHRHLGSRNITEKFPAIDFQRALQTKDNINIKHFGQILEQFHQMKYLTVVDNDVDVWILNHILPSCNTLKVLTKGESHESLHCLVPECLQADGNMKIILSEKVYRDQVLKCLCETTARLKKEPVIYLFITEERRVELCDILPHDIWKLHIINMSSENSLVLANEEYIISCPILTQLSIKGNFMLHQTALLALNRALREGKLPLLQSLCIPVANLKDKLQYLFDGQTTLPSLIHLNLCDCELNEEDVRHLCFSANKGLLPKLTSLQISLNSDDNFFVHNWVNLTNLSANALTKSGFKKLMKAIEQNTLASLEKLCVSMLENETCNLGRMKPQNVPLLEYLGVQRCIASKKNLKHLSRLVKRWNLQTLDISHSRGIGGKLSILMSCNFPSLRTLVLHDCNLNRDDMTSLSQANDKGKLSKLENLDVSENYNLICSFGDFTSNWKNLKRLRINYYPFVTVYRNGFEILNSLLEIGCFPVIEELRLSTGTDLVHGSTGRWQHLKRLDIVGWTYEQCVFILSCLNDALKNGDLPALEIFCLLTGKKTRERISNESELFSKLREEDVNLSLILS